MRQVAQVLLALLLGLMSAFAGHTGAFLLAHLGRSTNVSNFLYCAGEGVSACVFLAIGLWRLKGFSLAARIWCWLFGLSTLVFAVPAGDILLGGEYLMMANMRVMALVSCAMWFILLPLWRPLKAAYAPPTEVSLGGKP